MEGRSRRCPGPCPEYREYRVLPASGSRIPSWAVWLKLLGPALDFLPKAEPDSIKAPTRGLLPTSEKGFSPRLHVEVAWGV